MVLLEQARRFGYFDLPYATALGTETTILQAATHTALINATDVKKMSLPRNKIYSPELAGSTAVKTGSNDNTTPGGKSIMRGQTIPMFQGRYTGLTPGQYEDFEDMFARGNKSADFDTLGFVAYLGDDQYMCNKDFKPIPLHAPFIGDPTGMQLHDLTQFAFEFELNKGWYRNAIVVTLSFNHEIL
jgi:hypothetical protein